MVDRNFHITTPRLYLSYYDPSHDAHCDFLLTLVNSPEIQNANRGVASSVPDRETARKSIEERDKGQAKTGYGRYMVSLKPLTSNDDDDRPFSEILESCERIGNVSVNLREHLQAPRVPDIGFALLPPHWGKGYATEAVRAVIEYFENTRNVRDIAGYCNPTNENSKRMFRRLGFEDRGIRRLMGLKNETEVEGFNAMVWTSKSMDKDLDFYGL